MDMLGVHGDHSGQQQVYKNVLCDMIGQTKLQ